MCGIAGWIDFTRDLSQETAVLSAMTETLVPRGPDDSGFWFSPHAAFGQRRLVVVDPTGGRQPMIRQRGEHHYVLVYNGELYNTQDIRRELLKCGYVFEGWSDTEVLLVSYMEWGEKCLDWLNGIFSFAIWDEKKQHLFLARDRVGVKPLFYSRLDSSFLFGSEIKALLAHPLVLPKINREGLAEVLVMGPARTPGHGIFSGIAELKPGYCMLVDFKGVHIRQYWSLPSLPHTQSFADTVCSVRELVFDAVQRQLVSDVPLCTLLSGGLDSSIITTIAARAYQEEGREPLQTFSVDYAGNEKYFRRNEFQPDPDSPWVKRVAAHLATRHQTCCIATQDLAEALFFGRFGQRCAGYGRCGFFLLPF